MDACTAKSAYGVRLGVDEQQQSLWKSEVSRYADWLEKDGHWAAEWLRDEIKEWANNKQRNNNLRAKFGVSGPWIEEKHGGLVLMGFDGTKSWIIAGDNLDPRNECVHPLTIETMKLSHQRSDAKQGEESSDE
jgi:hypothetical protein